MVGQGANVVGLANKVGVAELLTFPRLLLDVANVIELGRKIGSGAIVVVSSVEIVLPCQVLNDVVVVVKR